MRALVAGAIALFPTTALAQTQVWVIDDGGGPGVDFTSLQVAIDAAAGGDVLLVKHGIYAPAVIDGKSLTIQAEAGEIVRVKTVSSTPAPMTVRNLPAAGTVTVRGLVFDSTGLGQGWPFPPLMLQNDQGTVVFEDCDFIGGMAPACCVGDEDGEPAVVVTSCAFALFAHCTMVGGDGGGYDDFNNAGDGGDGLSASGSNVVLYDTHAQGGIAGWDPLGFPARAGRGARVANGILYASGTTFRGGDGNEGFPGGCPSVPSMGLLLSAAAAELMDCELIGGSHIGFFCSPLAGAPPAALELGASLATLPGRHHGIELASPLREGDATSVTLDGAGGELAFAVASGASAYASLAPLVVGPLVVGSPFSLIGAGVLPPSGATAIPLTIQDLGAGVEGVVVHLQGFFVDPPAGFVLGEATSSVLLDAAF